MALKIANLSQKGGVGKSTLSRAIAIEYARNEWDVKIADMDLKQSTCSLWNRERMKNKHVPQISVETFSKVKDALKHEDNYDLMVFDGSGHADLQTLEIAKMSDYIILPSGLSKDDLTPQIKLAHELTKKGISRKKIGIALSRVGKSDRELNDTIEYIELAGYKYLGYIKEKTSISQSHDDGLAANETKYKTINSQVDTLIQGVVDSIQELSKK
ncbi:MAG: ParA family protein [Saprospiraceae bacterium]